MGTDRTLESGQVASGLLTLLPLTALAAFPFFSTFTTAKLLVAGPLLAMLIIVTIQAKERCFRLDGPVIMLLAYVAASLPAYFTSRYVHEVLLSACLDLAAIVVFLLGRSTPWHSQNALRLCRWLTAAGLGITGFLVAQRLSPRLLTLAALTDSSTMGNPDFVAEYLACTLPAGAFLLVRGRPRNRVIGGAGVAASLYGLATLGSATAALAAGAALLAGGSIWAIQRLPAPASRRTTHLKTAAIALVAFALLCGLGTYALSTTGRGRIYLYRVAVAAGLDQPVAGQGVGAFPAAFLEAQADTLADPANAHLRSSWTNARHAHNELLQQWVERGAAAALLLAAFAAACLAFMFRRRVAHPALLVSLVAALAVDSLGSVTFNQVPFRVLIFLVLGLACSLPRQTKRNELVEPGWPGRASKFAAGITALFLIVCPLWNAAADYQFTKADYAAARAINPFHGRTMFFMGVDSMSAGNLDEAIVSFQDSLDVYPNLSTLLMLGNCQTRLGQFARAEQWYRQAIRWKPTYSFAFANMAVMYLDSGQLELAHRHLVRALSLAPSSERFIRIRDYVCTDNPYCKN